MSPVYLYVEADAKGIRRIVRQALSACSQIAPDAEVVGLVVAPDGDAVAAEAAKLKLAKVLQADASLPGPWSGQACAKAVCEMIGQAGPGVLVVGNTSHGRDIAPCVAQRLGVPLLHDVTAAGVSDGQVVLTRPIYAGKAITQVKPLAETFVMTVRANAFPDSTEEGAAAVEKAAVGLTQDDQKVAIKQVQAKESKRVDLTEADIIVSGGMGLGDADGFKPIEELADALGAAVGASRAAVNAGWVEHAQQVGQTGKTVSPTLYIALGISGAIQHQAGMSSSKCIVAVNTDAEAPIFEVADYGIVANLHDIVPLLTEEVKKLQ